MYKKKELMAAFGTTWRIFLYVPVRRIWSVSVCCLHFSCTDCATCHMRNAMSSSFALTVKLHVSYPSVRSSVCPSVCPFTERPPAHTFDTSSALHFPPTSFIPLLQNIDHNNRGYYEVYRIELWVEFVVWFTDLGWATPNGTWTSNLAIAIEHVRYWFWNGAGNGLPPLDHYLFIGNFQERWTLKMANNCKRIYWKCRLIRAIKQSGNAKSF